MSIWGKLGGAAAGFAVGGPIGALLGGLAGHFALDRSKGGADATTDVAFTVGVIALGAKMAKADGQVTTDEVAAFKDVFKVPEGEEQNVARIFNLAKQDIAGYEAYAEQLANMFKDNRPLLEDVLEGLFHIATADGLLHEDEEHYLKQVSQALRLPQGRLQGDPRPLPAGGPAQPLSRARRLLRDQQRRAQGCLPPPHGREPSRQGHRPRHAGGVHQDRHRQDRRHQRGL